MSNARADYEEEETTACDFPEGSNTIEDRYVASSDREGIPVIPDEAPVEQPTEEVDPDSDEMLEEDEAETMDEKSILPGDCPHHAKPRGSYTEPGDEEGLPDDTGRSAIRG